MKTSFGTRVSQMGLPLYLTIFIKSLKSKSTQIIKPQKGNSEVSFDDTLLNFRLSVHLVQCTCKFHPFFKYRIIMSFSSFILTPKPPPFFPFSSLFAFFFLLFLFSSFTSSYFDLFSNSSVQKFSELLTFYVFPFSSLPIYPTEGRTGTHVFS